MTELVQEVDGVFATFNKKPNQFQLRQEKFGLVDQAISLEPTDSGDFLVRKYSGDAVDKKSSAVRFKRYLQVALEDLYRTPFSSDFGKLLLEEYTRGRH